MKIAVIAGFFGLWLWTYDMVNAFAADSVRTIHLTNPSSVFPWIIQPWTAVIYILGGVIFPLVPFVYYPGWRGIAFVMACITASSLMAFAIYWAWPVSMVRPEFTGGTLGERLMLWVFSVDKPANCFPSLHVIFAVLGAYLIDRAGVRTAARGFWWVFAAAVSATTVTSGQHYFIDIPGGVAVALAGYVVGRWLVPPDDRAGGKSSPSTQSGGQAVDPDPAFSEFVNAWPGLPAAMKVGMLAVVRASRKSGE